MLGRILAQEINMPGIFRFSIIFLYLRQTIFYLLFETITKLFRQINSTIFTKDDLVLNWFH